MARETALTVDGSAPSDVRAVAAVEALRLIDDGARQRVFAVALDGRRASSTRSPRSPSSETTSVTRGTPVVRVPVLSKATARSAPACSR